ncbi:MAG: hypothetical protein WD512_03855 [Candidatus Paceibacterota bacterium]
MISILVSVVAVLAGSLQKLNLFQDLESKIEKEIFSFQIDLKNNVREDQYFVIGDRLAVEIANNYSGSYLIKINLIAYYGGIIDNQEATYGNLSNFLKINASSVLEILDSELKKNNDDTYLSYRYPEYQPTKYLSAPQKQSLATKFIILRLLIKPESQLVNLLDYFGFDSDLYFEKIVKIN